MWDIGYGYGLNEAKWVEVVAAVRRETGRFLTRAERLELVDGWNFGRADRALYERDMAAREDVPAYCEADIPY